MRVLRPVAALGTAALAACAAPPAPLPSDALRNATYTLDAADPRLRDVTLARGGYRHEVTTDEPYLMAVSYVQDAAGDLDGDGAPDAAVVLVASPEGIGTVHYVVPALNRGGVVETGPGAPLGERAQVTALRIVDGRVLVDLLTFGPEDELCCPTIVDRRAYRWDGARLTRDESAR